MQSRREVQRERSRGTSKRMIRDLLILIILIFWLAGASMLSAIIPKQKRNVRQPQLPSVMPI